MTDTHAKSLVNWEKQCFSGHFKSIVSSIIEAKITSIQDEINEIKKGKPYTLKYSIPDHEQKLYIRMAEHRIDSFRAILKGVESIPECKKEVQHE